MIEGGYVLTNNHVVWPYDDVRVVLPDGTELEGVPVFNSDPLADLAVLGPIDVSAHWVGTAPPMAGLLRLVCAIPPSEPDVRLSPHPALHQMG